MLETNDTTVPIKLFGKTIQLPQKEEILVSYGNRDGASSVVNGDSFYDVGNQASVISHLKKDESMKMSNEQIEEDKDPLNKGLDVKEDKDTTILPPTPSTLPRWSNENPKTPSVDKETAGRIEEQSETGTSQEKVSPLLKPEKILPCPRCNSMDTKFCYYNNYNVNQPRHFCKNCQRYWTSGGTMRNVPVGAGRRKTKNSTSHYRHIVVPEILETIPADTLDGFYNPMLKSNCNVVNSGFDRPLYESMASALNLADQTRIRFYGSEENRISGSCGGSDNGVENSNRSSVTAPGSVEESKVGTQNLLIQRNFQGFYPQLPCFHGPPLPYPWNSIGTSPGLGPPNFPISFYPATDYWGCPVPGNWGIPWMFPPSSTPKLEAPNNPTSSPNAQTLGKHSREGEMMLNSSASEKEEDPTKHSNSDRSVWIPKTMRIDDPDEAARSSIWSTLGTNKDKTDCNSSRRNLFTVFESKDGENNQNMLFENSHVLQANPSALSLSIKFHETS